MQSSKKSLNHIIYQGKIPTVAGNLYFSIQFFQLEQFIWRTRGHIPFYRNTCGCWDTESIYTASSFSIDYSLIPDFAVVKREREDCKRRALEQISWKKSVGNRAGCATDGDNEDEEVFVDIVGSVHGKRGVESEGFTLVDALRREKLLAGSNCEVFVDTYESAICYSFPFIFVSFCIKELRVAICICM